MRIYSFVLLFILLLLSSIAPAQTSSQRSDQVEQAREMAAEQPGRAIKLLENIVDQALRRGRSGQLADAYILMAEINENIREYELAQSRRQMAIQVFQQSGQTEQIRWQFYHMGRLYLLQNQYDAAVQSFEIALKDATDEALLLKSREGLADARRLSNQLNAGLQVYDDLENQYQQKQDTRNLQRIQAKKANVYARQNDMPRANQSYQNSISNFKIDPDPANVQTLDEAKEEIITNAPAQELELRKEFLSVNAQLKNQTDVLVQEQMRLADAYVERGELDNAIDYVNQSKQLINEKSTSEQASEVYLRSSEIQAGQGNYLAALDDIKKYERSKRQLTENKQREIEQLRAVLSGQRNIDLLENDFALDTAAAAYQKNMLNTQWIIIGLLSLFLLGALISIYFIQKNVRAKRTAHQRLYLKSLRTQMNPHFIFNVLNSVNNFISKNDERAANKYLSEFSVLMRQVLKDSEKDFISLDEELDLIERYLKLEHARFRDKFDYRVERPDDIDYHAIQVPPMLIQPFVENAVWHGMRYKKTKGEIVLSLLPEEAAVRIRITDNGIGRRRSAELKTTNQKNYDSTALRNIDERIALINNLHQTNYEVQISDLDPTAEDTGTLVDIIIPA